jgi:RNA-binding protein YlmH
MEDKQLKEEELLLKRFEDLASKAYSRDICLFTGFLNLNEQDLFFKHSKDFQYVETTLFGGAKYCERKILCFGENASANTPSYPIACIHIRPALKKFAEDLTHRDFLGALVNLGIKRETLGDIIIHENEGYVFCLNTIADFILENLDRIRHTVVKCALADSIPETALYNIEQRKLNVASLRLDAIVGEVYALSRSQSLLFFREKKVFVNGRLCENNSYNVKSGDIISVRGKGKFIFDDILNNTKKGRYNVSTQIFL